MGSKGAQHLFCQLVGCVWREEAALGHFTNHWSSVSCGLRIPAALVTVNKMYVGRMSPAYLNKKPIPEAV